MVDVSAAGAVAAFWAVPAVVAAGAILALVTALVNHRTGRDDRNDEVTAARAADQSPQPKVLLPARSHFINRHEKIREGQDRIYAGETVLAIEGGPGVGKTAFAIELVHRVRADDNAADGPIDPHEHTFLWIDARNECPSLADICRHFSLLTGDQSLSTVADEQKLDALRSHLTNSKTLLVLDNLSIAYQTETQPVREFLRTVPAGSLVIASVNRPSAVEGSRIRLGDLDLTDALELIRDGAHRLGLDNADRFDEGVARRLHRAFGGNPRLIEEFLRGYSFGPQSLDERLAAVERGEGLAEMFGSAWEDLAADSKTVLAACAHLGGEATSDQLVLACGFEPNVLLLAVEELIFAGLLWTDQTTDQPSVYTCTRALQRFVLIEGSAQMFAPSWEELAAEPKIVLAACAYLRGEATSEQLQLACQVDANDLASALEELIFARLLVRVRITGQPNVYTCAPWLQRLVLAGTAEDTFAAITQRLATHYIRRFGSNRDDARAAIPHIGTIRTVLEGLFAQRNDSVLQALFVATLDIYSTLGLFDDRIESATLAYQSAGRAENHRDASIASSVVASTHAIRGELEQARYAVALGLLAAERSQAPGEIARYMRDNGFVRYRSGEPEQALEAIEGADELAREAGDLNNLAAILGLRTAAHYYVGALDDSEAAAKHWLRVCEEISSAIATARPICALAEIATHRREFRHAHELLKRARTIAAEFEDRRVAARVDLTEARMLLIRGHLPAAKQAASLAESQAIELGLPPEAQEAGALRVAATRARIVLPLRLYYSWRRPTRLTGAPVAGD